MYVDTLGLGRGEDATIASGSKGNGGERVLRTIVGHCLGTTMAIPLSNIY